MDALDRALQIVTPLEFAPPARYVNHGPMACEALVTLGADDRMVQAWADAVTHFLSEAPGPAPRTWSSETGWDERLGDRRLLPEWLTFFQRSVDDDGWRPVVARWVPRFAPGLMAALFHGVIRTAHAVRSLETVDTPARREELVWALASWATWYRPGAAPIYGTADAVAAAARGAHAYVDDPSIFNLHGVTGAMAVALLVPSVAPRDAEAAVAHLVGDHDELYGPAPVAYVGGAGPGTAWPALIDVAATSRDPHQVKLVEACRRAHRSSGDRVFVLAAHTVTGLEAAAPSPVG